MSSLRLRKIRQRRWEERLADLIVAGGTLGLYACSSSVDDGAARQPQHGDAAPDAAQFTIPCGNANPDPCICGRPEQDPTFSAECLNKQVCEAKGGTYSYSVGHPCELPEAAPLPPHMGIPCGNANPDPCICDRPLGDPTAAAACAAKQACEAAGGTYTYSTNDPCELPDARAGDAGTGPADARAHDAGTEAASSTDGGHD
jgi:hypothetical protein